jgi:hypothetical protein
MKSFLIIAGALLLHSLAHAQTPTKLKDITVAPSGEKATITFLVDGTVSTVVVEPKPHGVAEVRMKSISADKAALSSARTGESVRKVAAHIERKDVLVADVSFIHDVTGMSVTKRDKEKIEITFTFGTKNISVQESNLPIAKEKPTTTAKKSDASGAKKPADGKKSPESKKTSDGAKSSEAGKPSGEKKKSSDGRTAD